MLLKINTLIKITLKICSEHIYSKSDLELPRDESSPEEFCSWKLLYSFCQATFSKQESQVTVTTMPSHLGSVEGSEQEHMERDRSRMECWRMVISPLGGVSQLKVCTKVWTKLHFYVTRYTFDPFSFGFTLQQCERTKKLHITQLCPVVITYAGGVSIHYIHWFVNERAFDFGVCVNSAGKLELKWAYSNWHRPILWLENYFFPESYCCPYNIIHIVALQLQAQ